MQRLRNQAEQISKLSVTIEANANDEGHLYGSVGAAEIVAGLKQNDINLVPDQIRLEGVLKELGLYTVKVKLHHDVESELKVWVVPSVVSVMVSTWDGEEGKGVTRRSGADKTAHYNRARSWHSWPALWKTHQHPIPHPGERGQGS